MALRAHLRRHGFLVLALLAGPLGYATARLGWLGASPPILDGATLVNALLLAPVIEELIFRGGLQGLLDRTRFGGTSRGGVSVGNVLTSVAFSAAHFAVMAPALAVGVFLPSLVFGRLKQLYPSLLPAMLVHAWYNACYLAAGL